MVVITTPRAGITAVDHIQQMRKQTQAHTVRTAGIHARPSGSRVRAPISWSQEHIFPQKDSQPIREKPCASELKGQAMQEKQTELGDQGEEPLTTGGHLGSGLSSRDFLEGPGVRGLASVPALPLVSRCGTLGKSQCS